LSEIAALAGQIIAISPQLPDGSLSVVEKNALEFDVLSDVGNVVGRSFGLVYALPEELRAAMRLNDKALPGINGDEAGTTAAGDVCYRTRPPHRPRLCRRRLPSSLGAGRHRRHAALAGGANCQPRMSVDAPAAAEVAVIVMERIRSAQAWPYLRQAFLS